MPKTSRKLSPFNRFMRAGFAALRKSGKKMRSKTAFKKIAAGWTACKNSSPKRAACKRRSLKKLTKKRSARK